MSLSFHHVGDALLLGEAGPRHGNLLQVVDQHEGRLAGVVPDRLDGGAIWSIPVCMPLEAWMCSRSL